MPALDFQPRFRRLVLLGEKRQTIRKVRQARPIRVGDTLFLYGGQRRKGGGEKLMEATCLEVLPVQIHPRVSGGPVISIGGAPLSLNQAVRLAARDGFTGGDLAGLREFLAFFESTHGLPFEGVLIRW